MKPEHEPTGSLPDYGKVFEEANSPESTKKIADGHSDVASEAAENWAVTGGEHTAAALGQEAQESQSVETPEPPEAPAA